MCVVATGTNISLFITLSTNESVGGVMVSIAAFQAVDETYYLDVAWQYNIRVVIWFLPNSNLQFKRIELKGCYICTPERS